MLGASQLSSTLATMPEANVNVDERDVGNPFTIESAPNGADALGQFAEPVQQDREVVRTEIPDHADVALMQTQVHSARGNEVDVAKLAGFEQPLDRAYRRAVDEVWPHIRRPIRSRQLARSSAEFAGLCKRLLDEHVLAGLERLLREP